MQTGLLAFSFAHKPFKRAGRHLDIPNYSHIYGFWKKKKNPGNSNESKCIDMILGHWEFSIFDSTNIIFRSLK